MSHHHFTRDDRIKLETLKSQGLSNRQIAQILGFHKSSIGRELRRNSVRGRYCSTAADRLAINRRQEIERKKKLDHPPLLRYVISKSYEYWSPEQISGRLRLEYAGDPTMQVSHETIYLAAYNDKRFTNLFVTHWRQRRKKRKKRGLLKGKREVIRDRVSIEERPAIVASRTRLGDLEGDTIIGCGQSGTIVTLVDRKSLYLFAALCATKHAGVAAQATIDLLKKVDSTHLHTITFDKGTEFSAHKYIAEELSVAVYFARPYCSNDRARNENTNGLLRQYFPKKTRFDTISEEQLQRAVQDLNNRPRKTLNYRTPAEVFFKERVAIRV